MNGRRGRLAMSKRGKKKKNKPLSREAKARVKAYREQRKEERRVKKKKGADRRVYVKLRQLVLGD